MRVRLLENYNDYNWLYDQYWNQQKTAREIGEICGISKQATLNRLKKMNIPRRDRAQVQKIIHKKNDDLIYRNKDWLYKQYITLQKSTNEIGNECNTSASTILTYLKRFNITIRSISESTKIKNEKERKKKIYANKEWLKEQYCEKKKTIKQIAKECGVTRGNIRLWMKKYDIKLKKICENCGKIFYVRKHYQKYCSYCNNRDVRDYGISEDDYKENYRIQEGKCAICGKHQNNLKFRLCIDHDHQTNTFRGLLCKNCNRGLGYFDKEGTNLLEYAIKYLRGELPFQKP